MYDYWLGGKDNFPADREAAEKILTYIPDGRDQAHANRKFLRRAVRFMIDDGIRQFIDIGTGLPTQGQVHQVAGEIAPETRVVYVDNDPVAIAHARALLQDTEQVGVAQADLREPEKILQHPDTRALIDFDKPYGLMLLAIMHFIPDEEDPAGILGQFRDAMAPGSYLAISHTTTDYRPEAGAGAAAVWQQSNAAMWPRTKAELTRFFEGFDLVRPGIVDVKVWDTDTTDNPEDTVVYGAVGRRP
ncbi:MAG: SAM-dependent methyltransferase [Streptosporangiales bacterium]|nr:SAM-dependent methyltransferase [Streptosporangiales bacterium]